MLYEIINTIFLEYDIVIIADARFKNEIDFWKDRKLLISSILIKRLNFKNKKMNEKLNQHISENDVNNYWFDYVIEAKNIKELTKKIDYYLNKNKKYII